MKLNLDELKYIILETANLISKNTSEQNNMISENYHGEIYHFTSLIQASWIVDDNTIFANISQSDEDENLTDKRKYIDSNTPFISFTRDKNYHIQGDNRSVVAFVFDGDEIQKIRNARLYPFCYGGSDRNESEERVYGVKISPLHKYLKRIEITLSNQPYSWSSDRQFDEEDDLHDEFKSKFPEMSQEEIDKTISDYLVDKIVNNKLVGDKVVIKNHINESKNILNEITVQDASNRFYSNIPANDFMEIISTLQGGNQILQPETKWALSLYQKKSPRFMEDLYKLHNENGNGYLDIFNRAKVRRMIGGQEADLNQYKSISELGAFINSLDYEKIMGRTKGEMSNDVNAAANNIEIPYEDDEWKVVIPKSHEASCYWGKDTEWCTATRESDYYYKMYSDEGPLYININKETGEKYQFHFPSQQFVDSDDCEIDVPIFDNIEASNGLISFYRKKLGGKHSLDFMRLQYEEFASEETFVVFSNVDDGKYFIIDTENNQPVCDKWVLDYSFEDGVIRLELPIQGKRKYVLWSGVYKEILPECMYDYIGEFKEHVAVVMERGKYSYINDNGESIINQWFDDVDEFNSEYDIVTLNGEKNIFSREQQSLLMDVWVDEIQSPFKHDALATVWIDNKQNLVTEKGDFLFPDFVDVLGSTKLYNGYEWCVPFCLNRQWNFMGLTRKKVVSKVWFDKLTSLINERNCKIAIGKINGVEYGLDLELGILENSETGEKMDVSTYE